MITSFQLICMLSILAVTVAGGYYPLFRQSQHKAPGNAPMGEALTAGVFLALALAMMLPSSMHLLSVAYPSLDFPLGALIAAIAFLVLLLMEHKIDALRVARGDSEDSPSPPLIPLVMTIMIAIPSFFLGTALGVSEDQAALLIFVAIMMHKSSAAFALALKMVKSTMSRKQVMATFSLFALATPLGILVGQEIHNILTTDVMVIVKGVVLGLAAGTFLYMATLHEFAHAPMIRYCKTRMGFALMIGGFVLTVMIRLVMGEAHKLAG